jgi:lysozyme
MLCRLIKKKQQKNGIIILWKSIERYGKKKVVCIGEIMNISKEGIALIKKFEGCELEAYKCPAGVWTIGYGHIKGVQEGDVITLEEAEDMLVEELHEYENYINDMVTVGLTPFQFDALVAWVFNLGPTNLRESTLLRVLNEGNYEEVPAQIKRWNKAGGEVLNGLIRRREAEALLFQGEPWEHV